MQVKIIKKENRIIIPSSIRDFRLKVRDMNEEINRLGATSMVSSFER